MLPTHIKYKNELYIEILEIFFDKQYHINIQQR